MRNQTRTITSYKTSELISNEHAQNTPLERKYFRRSFRSNQDVMVWSAPRVDLRLHSLSRVSVLCTSRKEAFETWKDSIWPCPDTTASPWGRRSCCNEHRADSWFRISKATTARERVCLLGQLEGKSARQERTQDYPKTAPCMKTGSCFSVWNRNVSGPYLAIWDSTVLSLSADFAVVASSTLIRNENKR